MQCWAAMILFRLAFDRHCVQRRFKGNEEDTWDGACAEALVWSFGGTVRTQAKHRLKGFLRRQGRRYPGRAGWTKPYRRWLADLSVPLAPPHIALQEYRDTIDETEPRVARLTDQLRTLTPDWRWAPVVDALQALRGVSFVTAVGLVAEVGDIRRFTHPRQLMAFLGLVPSEYSSGPSVRRGGITKAGNPHARRLLAEAAWAYQGIPRIGRQMLYRPEGLPQSIGDIAWKAPLRLTSRFRKLVARGKANRRWPPPRRT